MSGRNALRLCCSLALAAAFAAPAPSSAQCRLCIGDGPSNSRAQDTAPPALEIDTNLSFGGLLLTGTADGSAVLRPDGSTSVSGGLAGVSGQRMAGTVRVQGEPGRLVRIDIPPRMELHSLSGDVLIIEEIITDLPRAPRLDSAGRLTFRFGGRLLVSGTADGDYRGELPLTVDYL